MHHILYNRPFLSSAGLCIPEAASLIAKVTEWWQLNSPGELPPSYSSYETFAEISPRTALLANNNLAMVTASTPIPTVTGPRGTGQACYFGGQIVYSQGTTLGLDHGPVQREWEWWCWFKLDNDSGLQVAVTQWDASASPSLHTTFYIQDQALYAFAGGDAYRFAETPAAAWEPGVWYFMNWWREADGYVRSQLNNSGPVYVSAAPSTGELTGAMPQVLILGDTVTYGLYPFYGALWQMGMTNGNNLTPAERAYLYAAGVGKTYDELVSETSACTLYSSWNPADMSRSLIATDSNRAVTRDNTAPGEWRMVRGKHARSTGRRYFEVEIPEITGVSDIGVIVGLDDGNSLLNNNYVGATATSYSVYSAYLGDHNTITNATNGGLFGDVQPGLPRFICVNVDFDAGKIWFKMRASGSTVTPTTSPTWDETDPDSVTPSFTFPPNTPLYPAAALYVEGHTVRINAGQDPFSVTQIGLRQNKAIGFVPW